MARRKKPPLFEFARESRTETSLAHGANADAPATSPAAPAPENAPRAAPVVATPLEAISEERAKWFMPGRALRVPSGYVFLAAAALVAVSLGAYVLGYRRGADAREQELVALRADPSADGPATDPLLVAAATPTQPVAPSNGRAVQSPNSAPVLGPRIGDGGDGQSATPGDPREQLSTRTADPLVIDDAALDPRTSGMNYYIVDRLRPDEALAAARYLRLHGVEAVVLPSDSAALRLVVAMRPFGPGEVSSAASKSYASRIHEIGRRWIAEDSGVSDFSTMYASKR